jgi:hypothetical protein
MAVVDNSRAFPERPNGSPAQSLAQQHSTLQSEVLHI